MIAPLAKLIDWSADMKKIMTTCAVTTTGIRGFLERNNRLIAVASIICFAVGLVLSHRVEPGVRVQKVTLAEETPALEFLPAGPGPHPVALFPGSKEWCFCYGEALAAAGFKCFAFDPPGLGASPQQGFSLYEAVRTAAEVARAVGPVDVFLGHSMGAYIGSGAVRDGDLKLKLFIAVGALPDLGEYGPPLLLLAGQFDEGYPPARLRERTDARSVISPWSDHIFEGVGSGARECGGQCRMCSGGQDATTTSNLLALASPRHGTRHIGRAWPCTLFAQAPFPMGLGAWPACLSHFPHCFLSHR